MSNSTSLKVPIMIYNITFPFFKHGVIWVTEALSYFCDYMVKLGEYSTYSGAMNRTVS